MATYRLGTIRPDNRPFELDDETMATHLAVIGGSGSGKSRLVNQLLREHLRLRKGAALIDPHGDLAEDLLGYVAAEVARTGSKRILKRVHYLEPSPWLAFGYDPFRFVEGHRLHPEIRESVRHAWLHAKADRISEVFQRKQAQSFEGMPRLQRVLRDAIVAAGTAIMLYAGDRVIERRLPFGAAQVLLDVFHPAHHEVYDRLAPSLPGDVRADFEFLHHCKRAEDLRRETESTLNRLRSLFSPTLKAILNHQPAVDLQAIVGGSQLLLCNLRETPYWSADQKVSLGGLLIHDLLEVMETAPREERKEFTLVFEESGELLGEDLGRAAGAARKFKTRLVFTGQDLSTFRKKELDLAPKLLSQCGTVICFQQKWPEDVQILARVLASGNIDFAPLVHEVERHPGYDWHEVVETSMNVQRQSNWSEGNAKSQQVSHNTHRTDSVSEQDGRSDVAGTSMARTASDSHESETRSAMQNAGRTRTNGKATANGVSEGIANGATHTTTKGGAAGVGATVSQKLVPLARVVREAQVTGQLRQAAGDQWEKIYSTIATLAKRWSLARTPRTAKAFMVETLDVPDPFSSPTALMKAVEWMKRELAVIHAYFFVPDLSPTAEEAAMAKFLAETSKRDGPASQKAERSPISESVRRNEGRAGKPGASPDGVPAPDDVPFE